MMLYIEDSYDAIYRKHHKPSLSKTFWQESDSKSTALQSFFFFLLKKNSIMHISRRNGTDLIFCHGNLLKLQYIFKFNHLIAKSNNS